MRRIIRTICATALAAALATAASAHSDAIAYTPGDGATVTELRAITMEFQDPMRIVAVAMTREGEEVPLERETGTDFVTEFVASPGDALAPGTYTVEWIGMSGDGHPMQGSFAFTLAD